MQITLLHNDNLITLSVSPDTTVDALLSLAQSEPQLRHNAQQHTLHISFAGTDITSQTTKTLSALNVQDNDVLQVIFVPHAQQAQQSQQRNMSPNEERAMLEMAMLEQALEDDPMNPELQRRLEQIIQSKNIQENLESAMENNPEAFARVIMLYVPMEVNNQKLTAFVDSGAQSTIMSLALAKQCNLEHLIDTRFAGMAVGVGTQPIVGRVHSAKVRVGDVVLVCSFTILKESSIDLLLGLDQLKRHAMSINLSNNSLELYGEKVPFMSEHQLPAKYRKGDAGGDAEMTDSKPATASSSTSQSTGHALGHSGANAAATGAHQRSTPQQAAAAAALQRQSQAARPAGQSATIPASAIQPAGNSAQMTPQQQAAWLAALLASAAQQQQQPQQQTQTHQPSTTGLQGHQQQSTAQQPSHSADKIASLTQLGFTSSEAVQALNATGGDVDAAAGLLFSR